MKIPALLAILTLAASPSPAAAHAFLQHANPAAGETVSGSPKELALEFSEQLEPAFSGVEVSEAAGHSVEAANAVTSGTHMNVSLKPLAPGLYRVQWHAVSVDTHRTDGSYRFTVKQ